MKNELPGLTDNQVEIMMVVWRSPDITVLEVWDELARTREIARNTVLTMMTRLSEKGWLSYRKVGNSYRYTATRSRQLTAKSMLDRLSDLVFEGSAEALVSSLIEGEKLSKEEAQRLKQIIDDAEKGSKKRKKRS